MVFRLAILGMILAEGLSLLSFVYPLIALPLLVLIGVAVFVLAWRRQEIGIYLLFGELFLGSRGHLLEYKFVSLRLVVFIAVFVAWAAKGIMNYELGIRFFRSIIPNSKFLILYLLTLTAIGWGMVNGYLHGNSFSNIFYDANGYLYLLILPAVATSIKRREQIETIWQILAAAIVIIALKTLILFLWFSFGFPGVATLYHWVIDLKIGEITGVVGSASRIFMQSQFWALMGVFVFAWPILTRPPATLSLPGGRGKGEGGGWLVVSAALLSVIMSLSRSFWLGGVAGAIFFFGVAWWKLKAPVGKLAKVGGMVLLIAALELAGLYALIRITGDRYAQAVSSRLGNPTEEAAGGARLLLLPELLAAIQKNPILGQGFGSEVSYKSYLPDRIRPDNPDGTITSYAFEWGYLDILLKIGLIGLLVYLFFAAAIFRRGWEGIRNQELGIRNLGLISGLVALLVLNITTPYLNHPLGIGYLIILYSINVAAG